MPRYFFDVKDGHRPFDASGFDCEDDTDAIIRATVLAIGVSLDMPENDPERRIAIINDAGREIGNVPVYSRPSFENPANRTWPPEWYYASGRRSTSAPVALIPLHGFVDLRAVVAILGRQDHDRLVYFGRYDRYVREWLIGPFPPLLERIFHPNALLLCLRRRAHSAPLRNL